MIVCVGLGMVCVCVKVGVGIIDMCVRIHAVRS